MSLNVLSFFAVVAFTWSCVSSSTHEALQLEHQKLQTELQQTKNLLSKSTHQRRVDAEHSDQLKDKLQSAETKQGQLQQELGYLKNQSRSLEESLRASRSRERQAREMNERRERALQGYLERLKRALDGGDLDVSIVDGRILVRLPSDVLFPSGSAKISDSGKATIETIARALSDGPQNQFQIEGHTDSDPINGGKYKTNWHLGYGRAMSVLNIFLKSGVATNAISAASFGEFRPRVENNTPEGKRLNRRIEIVMIPDLTILTGEAPQLGYQD